MFTHSKNNIFFNNFKFIMTAFFLSFTSFTAISYADDTSIISTSEENVSVSSDTAEVVATETTGVVGTETTEVVATETTGVVATETTGVVATETTGVVATETTGVVATETTGVVGTETTGVIGAETTAETSMSLFYDDEFHDYNAPSITIEINGVHLETLDVPPLIINDYTLVPLRDVFEGIGALIDWNGDLQQINIQHEDKLITMNINDSNAFVNDAVVTLDQAPKIINDRTMIPVRFVGESIGFTVEWNSQTHTVSLLDERPLGVFLPDSDDIVESDNIIDTSNDNLSTEEPATPQEETHTENTDIDISNDHLNYINIPQNNRELSPAVDVSPASIETQSHELATINNLYLPSLKLDENGVPENGTNIIIIESNGPITSVAKTLLDDNRLVLDISNSTHILNSEYEVTDNLAIDEIRFGTHTENDVDLTRVAMDLTDGISYAISLSFDRTKIYISFTTNTVSNIEYVNNNGVDEVKITGFVSPSVDIGNLGNPNQIIVNLPYSQIENHVNALVNGNYIHSIESLNINSVMARVVINLNKHGAYESKSSGNVTTITIKDPTYKNIDFDKTNKMITLYKQGSTIDINSIVTLDDFMNRTYVFEFQKDLSYLFGVGEFMIRDDNFHSVFLETTNGSTKLTVNENHIMTFTITEDSDCIYIKGFRPQEIYDKVIVIDPGHGAQDGGAAYFGVTEKFLNLDMSLRLVELLRNNGYVVYETRSTDLYPTLEDRAALANDVGDIFVSIHNNAASSSAQGTEVWYYPHANDSTIGLSSEAFATLMQSNLINILGSNNRGLKKGQLYVLNNTNIPAVLCEVGFMSNTYEMSRLNDPDYRQLAAQGMYQAIVDAFAIYTPLR